jgi:hypothetical protein
MTGASWSSSWTTTTLDALSGLRRTRANRSVGPRRGVACYGGVSPLEHAALRLGERSMTVADRHPTSVESARSGAYLASRRLLPKVRRRHFCSSSNSQVSGPSGEEPETAPLVKEQQSRAALLPAVHCWSSTGADTHACARAEAGVIVSRLTPHDRHTSPNQAYGTPRGGRRRSTRPHPGCALRVSAYGPSLVASLAARSAVMRRGGRPHGRVPA